MYSLTIAQRQNKNVTQFSNQHLKQPIIENCDAGHKIPRSALGERPMQRDESLPLQRLQHPDVVAPALPNWVSLVKTGHHNNFVNERALLCAYTFAGHAYTL